MVMPEMNGHDLAEQITALYPDIRVLFMSGYTADVIAHQGVLDDGVAFIQKPFSMTDMTEKVRDILGMATVMNHKISATNYNYPLFNKNLPDFFLCSC
jgi:FixJ family two-component response regulator